MKEILKLNERELFVADYILSLLSTVDDNSHSPLNLDAMKLRRGIEVKEAKKVIKALQDTFLIDTSYDIFSEPSEHYCITVKGKNLLNLHGTISLFVDAIKLKDENSALTKNAFKQNKIALIITIIALIASIIFNIINIYKGE